MDGIQSVHGAYLYPPPTNKAPAPQVHDSSPKVQAKEPDPETQKKLLSDMQAISQIFNTRLEYRYNETLKQVVVKVFDSNSDTLIKELPSAEMQAVYTRLKEALGLLIDRQA